MNIRNLGFIFISLILCSASLYSACCGKIDMGATLMDVDILESGKTIRTLHMKGVKGDATVFVYEGLCIKPGFMWGSGDGELTAGSIAVGYCLPLNKSLRIIPNVGMSWSYLHTTIDLEPLNLFDQKERFRSNGSFIGMEICYSLTEKWTLMGLYQYAWSQTHTKIGSIVSSNSHSCGPNYALGIDYSFNKNWSLNFGLGYNISLSKEKHGIRGKGAKLGIAYYF